MQHIHFIGICGTAMGSVAAAMHAKGFTVTGSDENVYPPMSTFLEQQGIQIFPGYKAENIPWSQELGGEWHPWQNDNKLIAGMDSEILRGRSKLHDRRHSA